MFSFFGKLVKKIKARTYEYINRMKIKNQLLMTYLIAVMIPILLLGIYLVYSTNSLVMQQQISETRAENTKVENSLKQLIDIAANISNIFYYDSDLRKIISTSYSDEEHFVDISGRYSKFSSITQNYSEIDNIYIYSENSTVYDSLHFKKVTPSIKQSRWYKEASSSWNIIWSPTIESGEECLSLIRQIPTGKKNEKAFLVFNISKSYLSAMAINDPLKTVVAVENGDVILSNDYNDLGTPLCYKIAPDTKQNVRGIKIGNENYLCALDILEPDTSYNYFSILTINYYALNHAKNVTLICSIILLISLVMPFLMIFYFSSVFSSRINILRCEMNGITKGNLEITENPEGNAEICELYKDLNIMIDKIKNLTKEVYMEKLIKERMINSQQKIEFKMLASQINPHFLYNTLETIRMKLICNGDRETANVIKILGKTMRRILEVKDEAVTLDSELEYIRYYLEIQRFRFGDRIEYEINVDDKVNAKEFYILPLLLQPIVENAFVHGLENKVGGGKITVKIIKEDSGVNIIVEDNGCGMSKEKCDSLNLSFCSTEKINKNNSIGLYNIHQRITLFYGKEYGLKIQSVLDKGTEVQIKLPLNCEVLMDNESADN